MEKEVKFQTKRNKFPLKLADLCFKTKTDAQRFVSSFLKNNKSISAENKPWVYELFKLHPRYSEKSINMKDIIIQKHLGNNHFGILYNNGTTDDFSYNKCLSGDRHFHDIKKTMRLLIFDQTYSFKLEKFKINPSQTCETCHCVLFNDSLATVDHINFFSNIADQFIKLYLNVDANQMSKLLKDPNMISLWKEFHLKNASLRLLCKSCNQDYKFEKNEN